MISGACYIERTKKYGVRRLLILDHNLRKNFFLELDKEKRALLNKDTGMLDEKYSKIILCPLCYSEHKYHDYLFTKDGYTFVRCSKCEMMFTNPQVDADLLGELYTHSKSNDLWVELQESSKEQTWKKKYYQDNIDHLHKYMLPNKEHMQLMDIGCNNGYFIEILQDHAPDICGSGIELSKKAFLYVSSSGTNSTQNFLLLIITIG